MGVVLRKEAGLLTGISAIQLFDYSAIGTFYSSSNLSAAKNAV